MPPKERDNEWLREQLADLWYRYFDDVPQLNDVVIQFGQNAATRLGSIKWGRKPVLHPDGTTQKRSIITITGHFKDPAIPDEVVLATIGHELVHYAHGFSSPLFQKYNHPHKGGVVDKELKARGLEEILAAHTTWLKANWPQYLKAHHQPKPRRRTRRLAIFPALW